MTAGFRCAPSPGAMFYSGVAPGRIWEQPARSGIWPKARSDGRRRDWPTFLYRWRHLLLYSGRTDLSSCTSGRICTDFARARQASGGEAAVAQGHTCCTVGSRSNLAVTGEWRGRRDAAGSWSSSPNPDTRLVLHCQLVGPHSRGVSAVSTGALASLPPSPASIKDHARRADGRIAAALGRCVSPLDSEQLHRTSSRNSSSLEARWACGLPICSARDESS
ncbi:unnamed protein product [Urochloa humidicola]